jgi:ribosome-associated heat shock protein Hsp15
VHCSGAALNKVLYDNEVMTGARAAERDLRSTSGVRVDKWLWAARFFKTRALAARACELGRIVSNGHEAKPSREVRLGDRLQIRTEAGDFHVEVRALSEIRGPAAVAQTLYHEPDESRELRLKIVEERRAMLQQGLLHEGKLSRRDREEMNRLRGRF